ncbi:uncharacterized protein LOC106873637 [Octopus bimaculoides]|uniref:uncharacterized protein LOC106873637 n=1 Tax=Octopus bimaculoides TaxID=37653 RepID=UPI00071C562C|nr:uncharacterized protein LOC106873637 [Octopus bimaculoides]|eukprot:XP_014776570.1 PREDICTED: uncharacterized protein LOC106873637 [Octopus bimaculoides]
MLPLSTAQKRPRTKFYKDLNCIIRNIPTNKNTYLLGDFNAHVGSDHDLWPICVGHFGIDNMNDNGQRLLEFCTCHNLCITNTFFANKPSHKASWRHPRSHHWRQFDLVITRRSFLNSVQLTRSYHNADCDTDDLLISSRVRILPKKVHHSKKMGRPRINTARISDPTPQKRFAVSIKVALSSFPSSSAESRWNYIQEHLYTTSIDTFRMSERHNPDCFSAELSKLKPVIEAKRAALMQYKSDSSTKTLEELRKARNKIQVTTRRCANRYWKETCQSTQLAADSSDTRRMYAGLKKALNPLATKSFPLKSTTGDLIKDQSKQMDRWMEYYQDLYSRETTVAEVAIEGVKILPAMCKLDSLPSIAELTKAIDSQASCKAPGKDGIPSEIIKAGKNTALLQHFYELLCQCWEEGTVPQDMRDANIIALYKNKGDRDDCNNYQHCWKDLCPRNPVQATTTCFSNLSRIAV